MSTVGKNKLQATVAEDRHEVRRETLSTQTFYARMRRMLWEFQLQDKERFALSCLDAEQLADAASRAKVNFLYVHAKDNQGNAYFNTKIGKKHAGLGNRDWLAEIITACRHRDIQVGVYFNFSRDNHMWALKPKWRQLWQDGSWRGEAEQQNPDWDNMCHNSPYREYNLSMLRELTTNYDIKAYWVDRLDWGGVLPHKFSCVCPYCAEKFASEVGADLPKRVDWNDPVWRKFVLWRSRCLSTYAAEIRRAVKSIKSDVVLSLNYYAPLDIFGLWFHGQDAEDLPDAFDNLTPEVHYEREGYIGLSVFSRFCRAASGGKPFDLTLFRGSGDLDYISKSTIQMQAEVLTSAVNGGAALFDDLAYPEGRIEPRGFARIGHAYAELERREPWLMGAQPVRFAALYYSKQARVFYSRNEPQPYVLAFLGAYKALLEAHVQFEIVTDRDLNSASLSQYRMLVLPDAACMSNDQLEAIRKYVAGGGNVVATHKASLLDEGGDPRSNFGLHDVFGVSYADTVNLPVSYVRPTGVGPLTDGLDLGLPLMHRDRQLKVIAAASAEVPATLVYAREDVNRVSHNADPPMPEDSPYAAIVAHRHGKGRCVYFPGRPDAVFARWGHPEFKRMLVNAFDWCTAETPTPLSVDAPASVEATLYSQPDQNRLIVHLLNFQSEVGRSLKLVSTKFMG
jgi:hypothetical protein